MHYKAEKERIANEVIAGLEQKFPGISSQVEMRDVATPVTWERYTGNWRGAYEGCMFGSFDNISKTLPGLDNFYSGAVGQCRRWHAYGRDVRLPHHTIYLPKGQPAVYYCQLLTI